MSQFMLLKSEPPALSWPGTALSPLSEQEPLLGTVARHYFGSSAGVWSVTDPSGVLEPLVDQIWEIGQRDEEMGLAPFATFLMDLVHRGVEFVLWCSDDFEELPLVTTWDELARRLREQTAQQPADLFVRFCPSSRAQRPDTREMVTRRTDSDPTGATSIDWEALAREFSAIPERGSRHLACAAVEGLVGAQRLATAVDHYVEGRPGSELARSILWLLHPWESMLRCREIYDSSEDIDIRRSAVELLRVVADARVLPWVADFLADPDPQIQSWGILIIDQLVMGALVERGDCEAILAQARLHSNASVREAAARIELLDNPASE